MKKPFYLMLLLATLLTVTACSNDKNTLNGTTWSASYGLGSTSLVIEFEDNSKVSGFIAENGNISHNVYYGTYSFTDGNITFNDFLIAYSYIRFYFSNGTVSGNYMTLNYYHKSDNGDRYDHQMTFHKQ